MDYLRTQAESYERKLKEKDKQINELKKHNKWLINKVNELSSIDEIEKLQNKFIKCKKVAMNMFTEKERLEKIKGVHLERIKQNEFYTSSFIHVGWLIEQAEKVGKLEETIERLENLVKSLEDINRDLAESINNS